MSDRPARRETPGEGRGGPGEASSTRARLILGGACFLAGASMMVIEITGNRLLAPIFGNSLYTWTALIGVVLAAFSAGGYLGGWLVDRWPEPRMLGTVLACAALSTLMIPGMHGLLERTVDGTSLIAGPVLLSMVLFLVPGCLLGAVTPFAIRMASLAKGDRGVGAAAGTMGMSGSLGSFAGTFASGFILIPVFEARLIFLLAVLVLLAAAAAVFAGFRSGPTRRGSLAMAGLGSAAAALFFMGEGPEKEGTLWSKLTFYHWIRVFEKADTEGRVVRYLQMDTTVEGAQVMETGELTLHYQRYWELAAPLGEGLKRAVFIGAGAFGMPERLAERWKEAQVDVVEIDPEVIKAGYDYFRLGEYENVTPHAMDGRRFLATSTHEYDLIFGDAYNGVRNIPAHLTTREFFETVRARLSKRGVFMINIISGLTGENGELFRAIYGTMDAVFENVEVYSAAVEYVSPHNILIVASERELESFYRELPEGMPERVRELAGFRVAPVVYGRGKEQWPVLTDDRNPVEAIVARQLRFGPTRWLGD